jgi:hypothetical protein
MREFPLESSGCREPAIEDIVVSSVNAEGRALNTSRKSRGLFYGLLLLTLAAAVVAIHETAGQSQKPAERMSEMAEVTTTDPSGNPCDPMAGMAGMNVMGESMAAMANHMCMTPMRAAQPGDEQKAKAVVAQVRTAIEKYKDYKKAVADGYVQANPAVDQPQFHFNNEANAKLADSEFDPSRPTSLLYLRTPMQKFKLEGVMFTARPNATEDELNQRIPLSVARWHKHTNFCGAPENKVKEYFGKNPKFGMFGSIHTREACEAEGGTFMPVVFTWMIHVFPFEDDFKNVFSMNDDVPHVH